MATYVASLTGNDGNSGSESSPFRTIARGLSSLNAPGDKLLLRGGTWNNERLKISYKYGASGNPIVVQNYPGEIVTLEYNNNRYGSEWEGAVHIDGGNYVVIKGVDVNGQKGLRVRRANQRGCCVYTTGVGCGFEGIHAEYCFHSGLFLDYGTDCFVDYCYALENAWDNNGIQVGNVIYTLPQDWMWSGGISAGSLQNNGIIRPRFRGCVAERNRGEGIGFFGLPNGGVVEDCISFDNYSVNIYLDSVNGVTAQRNIIYQSPNSYLRTWGTPGNSGTPYLDGLLLANEQSGKECKNMVIVNNFIREGGLKVVAFAMNGANTVMSNILAAHNTANSVQVGPGPQTNGTYIGHNYTGGITGSGGNVQNKTYFLPTSPVSASRLASVLVDGLGNTRGNPTITGAIDTNVSSNNPVISNPGTLAGNVGTPVSQQIIGSGPGTLSYSASGLPNGLSINTNTGLISGTPTTVGTYNSSVVLTSSTAGSVSTSFQWVISQQNLAYNKTATASSSESGTTQPGNAVDGNPTTRWSSLFADPQWLQIDLGATATITGLKLVWEAAYSNNYRIEVSADGNTWTTIHSNAAGTGGTENISGLSGGGRYVRLYSVSRATAYGVSLYEFEVYGTIVGTVSITNPGSQSGTTGTAVNLQIQATDTPTGTKTYSATGLPTGLSINTSTGLITGTPTAIGTYTATVTVTSTNGGSANINFSWSIAQAPTNLALNKTATASSQESGTYPPANATDGNTTTTRWSSVIGADPQWLQVDLGAVYAINQVRVFWEAAYATAYQVQLSVDGTTWTTVFTTTTGAGGSPTHTVSGNGRYVRVYGTARATAWGYSIWELQVFGSGIVSVTNPGTRTTDVGTAVSLQIAAQDSSGGTMTYSATGLPTGLSINTSTGLISGTPTTAGTYSSSVTVSSTSGGSQVVNFTWDVVGVTWHPIPGSWGNADIGDVGVAGEAAFLSGVFRVKGSGQDIAGNADSLHMCYQTIVGDFVFTARVASTEVTSNWAKFGMMIRSGLGADAQEVNIAVNPHAVDGHRVQVVVRDVSAGWTVVDFNEVLADKYLRLQRVGNTLTAYSSPTGASGSWVEHWTSDTIIFPSSCRVGLIVCAQNNTVVATGTFDNVKIQGSLPAPWSAGDFGAPAVAGYSNFNGEYFNLVSGGLDVWGVSDQGHFIYQPLSGNFTFTATLGPGVFPKLNYAKVGVMIRESLNSDSKMIAICLRPDEWIESVKRSTTGGTAVGEAVQMAFDGAVPYFHVVKNGSSISLYADTNAGPMQQVGSTEIINFTETVLVGLFLCANDTETMAQFQFLTPVIDVIQVGALPMFLMELV